ncbi:alkaline phosphatase D family protein [Nocardia sp. NPDC050175]|uniref:alkaline phosphatase D family protein n=1 Tax=Nocardia sp. NPDC050175 TaxID=3364317 RepID=UPI0037B4668D
MSTDDRRDHFDTPLARRLFLTGAAAIGATVAMPGFSAAAPGGPILRQAPDDRGNLLRDVAFGNGVMAGVPRTDGATLWTRVSGGPFGTGSAGTGVPDTGSGGSGSGTGSGSGSAGLDGRLAVIVSRNENLSSPDIAEQVTARGNADGTVHFDATGLRPGEQYFYQFRAQGTESPVGRFKTLRPADSNEPVRIGWFTCQGFEEGYYATHRHLADEDLDFVVCLGDYVYEFTAPGVRGVEVNAYPQVLEQMREKYRKYRSDADLKLMHSKHAFVPIWDDHEFRNNYTKVGWTFPLLAQADTAVGFQQKKQWAWQAWFEHMPVPRFAGDPLRTYRTVRVGKTVELFAQDARQYRDIQGCGDSLTPIVCADADDPARSMLGSTQKKWLLDGMAGSDATWKVMANANMMMGMVVDDQGKRAWLDTWDGYGAERTDILSRAAKDIKNMVVVTGDDHDGYAGELWDTGFAPGTPSAEQVNAPGTARAGVEFVVPSVTSHNTGDTSESGAHTEEANRLDKNPHVKHIDMVRHGYGVLEAVSSEVRFHFRDVDKLNQNAGVSTSKSLRVPSGQAILEET